MLPPLFAEEKESEKATAPPLPPPLPKRIKATPKSMEKSRKSITSSTPSRVLRSKYDELKDEYKTDMANASELEKKRLNALLGTKDRIYDIEQEDRILLEKEKRFQRRQQELQQQQKELDVERKELESQRKLLDDATRTIMDEMTSFKTLFDAVSNPQKLGYPILERSVSARSKSLSSRRLRRQEVVDNDTESHRPRSGTPPSWGRMERSQLKPPRGIRPIDHEVDPIARMRRTSRSEQRQSQNSRRGSIFSRFRRSLSRSRSPSKSASRRHSGSRRSSGFKPKSILKRPRTKESISYAVHKNGTLRVNAVNARGAFGVDGRTPNTYIEMECEGQVQQSSVMRRDSNPRFCDDEQFIFAVSDCKRSVFIVSLMDAETENCLASLEVPCRQFMNKRRASRRRF